MHNSGDIYELLEAKKAEQSKKKRQRRVLKVLYFVQTGAAAGLIKFIPVFFAKRLNLSATNIGIALVVGNIANFFGGLFWGRMADLSGRYKLTMLVTNASSVFFNFCLLANDVSSVFWVFLADYVLASFFGSCWGTLVDAVAVIGSDEGASYGRLRLWAALGWGTLSVATGYLVDLTNIGIIFATFGVGMAASMILVMFFFSDPPKKKPRESQPAAAPTEGGAAGHRRHGNGDNDDVEQPQETTDASDLHEVLKEDPGKWNDEKKGDERDARKTTAADDRGNGLDDASSSSSSLGLRAILCRTEVALLLLNLFVQGVLIAFVESFLYVYLAQVYRVPAYFLGLCTFVAAVFECPVFFYSDRLIAALGLKGVLTLAQLLYATRVWVYTLVPNNPSPTGFWLFLLTEPLHAFVFAAMWSAAVEYSRILAPPEHQGIMQAFVRGLYYFIGNGVGSVLGGLIIDSEGGGAAGFHLMYRFGGVAMAVWSLTWHSLMCLDRCLSSSSSSSTSSSRANKCRQHGDPAPRRIKSGESGGGDFGDGENRGAHFSSSSSSSSPPSSSAAGQLGNVADHSPTFVADAVSPLLSPASQET